MEFVVYRNIVPVILALFGNPEFASKLLLAPERHYMEGDMMGVLSICVANSPATLCIANSKFVRPSYLITF